METQTAKDETEDDAPYVSPVTESFTVSVKLKVGADVAQPEIDAEDVFESVA